MENKTSYDQIKKWLEAETMRERIARILPKGIPADGWIEAALVAVRTTYNVEKCQPLTTLGALMTIAGLGLRLEGPLGQAYLSPRWVYDKKKKGERFSSGHYECQVQIGYRGLIETAYRNPEIRDIEATIVQQNDVFEFQLGTTPLLNHTWDIGNPDRGPWRAVYSGLRYRDGYYSFVPYSIADVLDLRAVALKNKGIYIEKLQDGKERFFKIDNDTKKRYEMSAEQAERNPWIGHPRPMMMKTAIRWSAKYWKVSVSFEMAASLISLDDAGVSQGLAAAAEGKVPESVRIEASREAGHTFQSPGTTMTLDRANGLKGQMIKEALGKKEAPPNADDKPGEKNTGVAEKETPKKESSQFSEPGKGDPSGMTAEEAEERQE